jgi:hypothetical protein
MPLIKLIKNSIIMKEFMLLIRNGSDSKAAFS